MDQNWMLDSSAVGTDNGPACPDCQGTVYTYAPNEGTDLPPSFAYRCIGCKRQGLVFVPIRDLSRIHREAK